MRRQEYGHTRGIVMTRMLFPAILFGCFGSCEIALAKPHQAMPAQSDAVAVEPLFTETTDVMPLEDRYRRKWDAPIIADFDQDGWADVLLTEHSSRARLFWNNGGTFSKPVDLIKGDTHGVAVGDYNRDGRINVVVSRGGGGGKKPRNPVAFEINRDRSIEGGGEFSHFERTRGRAAKLIDWNNDGKLDLVLSAFPLKSQRSGANHLFRNQGQGEFPHHKTLPQAQWMGFRTLATDFNTDGHRDLIFFGGNDLVAVQGREGMGFEVVTNKVFGPLARTSFVTSITEIDYDNDGDHDLFLTRADHPFEHKTYYAPAGKRFAFFARFAPVQYDDLRIDGPFRLDNLQMAFPHFDVMVGAKKRLLEFEVDRHGHKDVVLHPAEAQGWPEERTDKGLYIGHVGEGVWRVAVDTKSPTTGVVHKVVSTPVATELEQMPARLLENRGGEFVDVTQRLGIDLQEQTAGATAGDFDNDGWCDLIVVRQGNPATPTEQVVYLNQRGKWFGRAEQHAVVSKEVGATGVGAAAFDYDHDGDLDLVCGAERGRWRLFQNDLKASPGRNHVTVQVGYSPSGMATPQGAILTIRCGERVYRRIVGSDSAAFGHGLNNRLHVGLGSITDIDSAMVQWTNAETASLEISEVNRVFAAGQASLSPAL